MNTYILNKGLKFRRESFGGLLLNKILGGYITVNKTAADIISAVKDDPLSTNEISNTLSNFYSISQEKLKEEIKNFIDSYSQKKIFVIEDRKSKPSLTLIKKRLLKEKNKKYPAFSTAPIEVCLNLSYTCNQDCMFCYARKYPRTGRELSTKDYFKIIDQLRKNDIFCITFLGGEPLLCLSKLFQILNYANDDFAMAIVSNGSANGGISKKLARMFLEYKTLEIQISLESNNAKTHDKITGLQGSYDLAINSLKNLVHEGKKCSVKTVVLKQNQKDILKLIKLVKKIGSDSIYLMYPMPCKGEMIEDFLKYAPEPRDYVKLIEQVKKEGTNRFAVLCTTHFSFVYKGKFNLNNETNVVWAAQKCSAGNINLEVTPTGDAYSCSMSVGTPEFNLGNLKRDSIKKIWNNKKLDFFRKREPKKLKNNICINCMYVSKCVGGCPMAAYLLNKDEYGGDPTCPLIRKK